MVKKLSKLELAQEHAEAAVKKVNEKSTSWVSAPIPYTLL